MKIEKSSTGVSNSYMLSYWLKFNDKSGLSDFEILDKAYLTLIRVAKDINAGGATTRQQKVYIQEYCRSKYLGCRYAAINMSFFECLKYDGV